MWALLCTQVQPYGYNYLYHGWSLHKGSVDACAEEQTRLKESNVSFDESDNDGTDNDLTEIQPNDESISFFN